MANKNILPARQAIVLLSGGLDSAVTLYLAKSRGFKCRCLIFDYGQRHRREIAFAKKIALSANCPYQVLKINLPWKGSALLDQKIPVPRNKKGRDLIPSTYVPARNIIFLSFALSFAEAKGVKAVFIGAHAQDYSGYPDCRPEFFGVLRKLVNCATKAGVEKKSVKVYTPLLNKRKSQIIRLGHKLKVPFEITWSCYSGGKYPCGSCDSCYFRARGFRQAGLKDPLLK